jgi:ubiquinone/menaquinone biosynthesis C-methylase UbiE
MEISQKNIFLNSEGDNWFKRNEKAISNKNDDIILKFISPFLNANDKILEIGCSNGTNLTGLENLNPNLNLSLNGIDPSEMAIKKGKVENSSLNLQVGTSDDILFKNHDFNVVICGFFFYLVDRNLLFKTISEIDRILKYGGFLVIIDFEVISPGKNKYKHFENIYSYKHNYSKFFTSGNHFSLVGKKQYYHADKNNFHKKMDERISCSILYKESIEDIYKLF